MTDEQRHDDQFGERLGMSLRRRPWAWLGLTLVAMVVAWSTGASVLPSRYAHAWVDWLTVGLVAYSALVLMVLLPLVVVPRSRGKISEGGLATIRWSLATAPFLVGVANLALGGHAWSVGIAFLTTVLLLAYTAATVHP